MDREARQAKVHMVAQSQTQLNTDPHILSLQKFTYDFQQRPSF